MLSYALVEPCCGSAALTLHLLGATRTLSSHSDLLNNGGTND